MIEEIKEVPENIPFEEQQQYGFFNSLMLTLKMLITKPGAFFGQMHINKGLKLPFLFLILMLSLNNTLNYIYISAGMIDPPSEQLVTAMESDPEYQEQADNIREMFSKEPSPFDILFSIITNFIFMYLLALYWHLILRSLGIALNGLEATVRIFCYSSVVLLTSVVPVSGNIINFAVYIWWAYLMYIGISEAHEVSKKLAFRGITVSLLATFVPFMFILLAVL